MPLPRFVQAGMRMLQRGGTAADAAVAVAAALNVTEPCSTGDLWPANICLGGGNNKKQESTKFKLCKHHACDLALVCRHWAPSEKLAFTISPMVRRHWRRRLLPVL